MDQVTVPRATAQQALEALEELNGWQSLAPPLASQAGRQAAINLRAALEQPEPPPEAQTEAERLAYCAGWWAAMEQKREQPAQDTDCHAQGICQRSGYSIKQPARAQKMRDAAYTRRPTLREMVTPEQENPTRQMPEWMDYDQATDVLTIHGRRYSAAMFGERGFLSPAGTLLQVAEGQPDCVTLMTILPTEPK
jgi:hypothetical protein